MHGLSLSKINTWYSILGIPHLVFHTSYYVPHKTIDSYNDSSVLTRLRDTTTTTTTTFLRERALSSSKQYPCMPEKKNSVFLCLFSSCFYIKLFFPYVTINSFPRVDTIRATTTQQGSAVKPSGGGQRGWAAGGCEGANGVYLSILQCLQQ